MSEKYYFILAEVARLLEVNERKFAVELEDVNRLKAFRFGRNFREVLYRLEDIFGREAIESAHSEIRTMFILVNDPGYAHTGYAFTITEAVRLTRRSRSWISKLIQEGKITKFKGRRIKDWHKKNLISAKDLSVLGLDFKPDDVFKLFTLK